MSIRKKFLRNRKHRLSTTKRIQILLLVFISILVAWFIYEAVHLQPAEGWSDNTASDVGKISIPKDDAPHQAQIEWWYYNGYLISESGKKYSFHDTVFLVNSLVDQVVSHVSFNDHQTGKHYIDQRKTGGNPSINTDNHFEFKHGDWLMAGGDGKDRLHVISDNFSFELSLLSMYFPVLHGNDGVISLGDSGSSYYYSRTRMTVSGVVNIGNTTEKVTGISWFDHQWGDFSVAQLSWDWFSLQLDNNIDAMIYQLRDKSNNPLLYMASLTQNGNTELLSETDFTMTPGKLWKSDLTGTSYPLEWKIRIPKKDIDITTKRILKNTEFNASMTTYNIYWEGPVDISGTHTGKGFMELSGYAVDR